MFIFSNNIPPVLKKYLDVLETNPFSVDIPGSYRPSNIFTMPPLGGVIQL